MQKKLSTAKAGFIDPLSLITFGFLVVGLIVSTSLVTNKKISFNPQKQAATACLDPCVKDTDCNANEYCYKPARPACPVCKLKSGVPAPKPVDPPKPVEPKKKVCTEGYTDTTGECKNNKLCRNYRFANCQTEIRCDGPACEANRPGWTPPPAPVPPSPPKTPSTDKPDCAKLNGQCLFSISNCSSQSLSSLNGICPSGSICCNKTVIKLKTPAVTPTTPSIPAPASKCRTACKSDEICSPTPYGYYCQKKSLITTADGTKMCDGNTLMVMKSGGWIKDQYCQYGCKNNSCVNLNPIKRCSTDSWIEELQSDSTYKKVTFCPGYCDTATLSCKDQSFVFVSPSSIDCNNNNNCQEFLDQGGKQSCISRNGDYYIRISVTEGAVTRYAYTNTKCNPGFDTLVNKLIPDGYPCETGKSCQSGSCTSCKAYSSYPPRSDNCISRYTENRCEPKQTFGTFVDSYFSSGQYMNDAVVAAPIVALGLISQNPTISTSPWFTNTMAALNLAQGPIAVATCEIYGHESPECAAAVMGEYSAYSLNPTGYVGSLTNSTQTLNETGQGLINNKLSGLDFSSPDAGTLGTYGGQTIISRSNMPEGLSPQDQALWIARYQVAENFTYLSQHPALNSSLGYMQGDATSLFNSPSLNQALSDVPDPTGYLAFLEKQAQTGTSVDELVASSQKFITDSGVNVITDPKITTVRAKGNYATLADGTLVPLGTNDSYGTFNPGALYARTTTDNNAPVFRRVTPETLNGGFELSQQPSIVINKNSNTSSTRNFTTLGHEFGHFAETLSPLFQANAYVFNPANGISSPSVLTPQIVVPGTEFFSTLYGIKAAQTFAPTSINMAVDAMNGNLILNTWIMGGNPAYLTSP